MERNRWSVCSGMSSHDAAEYATISDPDENSTVTLDISLHPEVTLDDAVTILQVPAGLAPEDLSNSLELFSDGRISMQEVIYILQKLTGLRSQ